MSCLPIVSDSCDQREQVFRVGAAAPRVFNSKYLFVGTPLHKATEFASKLLAHLSAILFALASA